MNKIKKMFSRFQKESLMKSNDSLLCNEIMGRTLAALEQLAFYFGYKGPRIFDHYSGFDKKRFDYFSGFNSKRFDRLHGSDKIVDVNSLIKKVTLQLELFRVSHNEYISNYHTYDFPNNLTKDKIVDCIEKWKKFVPYENHFYFDELIRYINGNSYFSNIEKIQKEKEIEIIKKQKEKELKEIEMRKKQKEKEIKLFEELAIKNWSKYNIKSMEKSIDYLEKAKTLNDNEILYPELYIYYYLYKAYNESDEYKRSDYLNQAKEFNANYLISPFNDGSIPKLYNKSINIIELKNKMNNKDSDIRNLNYELNSIKNSINNVQSLINSKNNLINNKNNAINSLNNLANSLIVKGGEINNGIHEIIKEEKNKRNELEQNINKNKDFLKQIKEYEKQKKEDIQNLKNNNIKLKQQNAQLISTLTLLESKLL